MTRAGLLARFRASGRLWNTILVVLDAAVVVIATVIAYYARFEGTIPATFAAWTPRLMLIAVPVYVLLFRTAGQYNLVLRYVGVDSLLKLSGAATGGFALLLAADLYAPQPLGMRPVPIGVLFIQAMLVFLGASAARMSARVIVHVRSAGGGRGRRILIVGAGSAGSLLLREIQNRPDLGMCVAGFLDDDPALAGQSINGVRVVGTTGDLAAAIERDRIEEVVVAMPSAPRDTVRRILNVAADSGVETRITPALVMAKGAVSIRDLRSVDVEDLLGRDPTPIDVVEVRETIAGKVVAVTGAAGSIGSELCRQILSLGPKRLLLMEIDETRLYELWLELSASAPDVPLMCLCDIRSAAQVDDIVATHRPEVVLHAAAYKHVPLMEIAPAEAIKTNVMGTQQLVASCKRNGVGRFVLISTDKAVAPVNMMGLSKALAEKVVIDAAGGDFGAVAVRFGNVLASRGSVVPIFEEQLRRGGPLTVTDPEVTRYFMTIPEAARLVLQAQAIGEPGDVFVLEMGEPVRIVDLARRMIALSGVPADIRFVGLRPGEKLHESLIGEMESLDATGRSGILRVRTVHVPSESFLADVRRLTSFAQAGEVESVVMLAAHLEPSYGAAPSDLTAEPGA